MNRLSVFLLWSISLITAAGAGWLAREHVYEQENMSIALSNFLVAQNVLKDEKSEALTKACEAAVVVIERAPSAYDGYEALGDCYARLNRHEDANKMYKQGIERLVDKVSVVGILLTPAQEKFEKERISKKLFKPET